MQGRGSGSSPGVMDVARMKPPWLCEVTYERTRRLGRIPPRGCHQLPGSARRQPLTRWTTSTRTEFRKTLGEWGMNIGEDNPRRARGEGGVLTPPSGFSVILHTFSCILSAPFLKISAQGNRRSGHQVRSSDPTSQNICDCTVTTVLKGST